MKSILKVGFFIVAGILGYNYFFGTEAEKAQSKEIVNEVAGAGKKIFKTVSSLIKDENQKFKEGKYDNALNNIGDVLKNAKEKASKTKSGIENILDGLIDRKERIQKELNTELDKATPDQSKIDELKLEFEQLTNDLENTLDSEDLNQK